jgi:O-antigen/teichoic acid export membrane protein
VRSVGALTAANVASLLLSLVQGILVARWLGPTSYGVAALVMSYPALVFTFFDARSAEATTKFLSEFHAAGRREQALATCQLGYLLDLAIALAALFVVWLSAPLAVQQLDLPADAAFLVVLSAAAGVPRALVGTSSSVVAILGRFPMLAAIDAGVTVIRVALVIGLVSLGYGVAGVVWGNALGGAATGLGYAVVGLRAISGTWGSLLRDSSPAALRGRRREILSFVVYSDVYALTGLVQKKLDVVLLGYLRGPSEVGFYALAKNIVALANQVVGPLQNVAYPEMLRLHGIGGEAAIRSRLRRGLPLLAGLGFAGGAVAVAAMPTAVLLLVDSRYAPAIPVAQILLVGMVALFVLFWFRPMLLVVGWIGRWTAGSAANAVGNLLLWLLLIPPLGAIGAALGWTASVILGYVGFFLFYELWRRRSMQRAVFR